MWSGLKKCALSLKSFGWKLCNDVQIKTAAPETRLTGAAQKSRKDLLKL